MTILRMIRRNLLDAINEVVDDTILPQLAPPPPKESLAVFLRVKPKTEKELEIVKENKKGGVHDDNAEIVSVESDYLVAMHAPKESQTFKNSMNGMGKLCHRYTFSRIFKQDTGQKQIFKQVVQPKVKDFLGGQNQLIFTYGATSAGKTFTIQGTPSDAGIVPKALDALFNTVGDRVSCDVPLKPVGFSKVARITPEQLKQVKQEKEAVFRLGLDLQNQQAKKSTTEELSSCQGSVSSPGPLGSKDPLDLRKLEKLFPGLAIRDRESAAVEVSDDNITYTVWVSFLEIYNENIYDLLQKVPVSKNKRERVRQNPMKLSEDGSGATYVKGLREVSVKTADEAYQLLMIGRDNLHFAETKLNHNSSRSHCIFNIKVIRVAALGEPHLARVSLLSFCDLAGSERIAKTNNVGERQKEAGNINTSLLVLGRCIKAIRHNQSVKDVKKHQLVPYRESKLTRLFKTFFSGLGKASIIICISQAPYLFDESIHVLKFASIASKVTIEQIKQPAPKPLRKKVTRFGKMVAGGKKNSIVAHQATAEQSGYLGRGTINWEAPRVRSTMLPDQLARISRNTIKEIDVSGDDLEDTVIRARQDDLLAVLDDLKEKLDEEKKKNERQEAELREELCKEFNDMLVQVETDWERRVEVERERASELAEWRIAEYGNAVRNEKRRRRDDDRGSDNETLDLRAKNLLDKKEIELEAVKNEKEEKESTISVLKNSLKSSTENQNKLQIENTKMQFELAEMRRMLSEKEKDLEESKRIDVVRSCGGESDEYVTLEESLAAIKEELIQKEVEIHDMAGLLEEAQEEFIEKEAEKAELERLLKVKEDKLTQKCVLYQDLVSRLEESQVLLQEANDRLEEQDVKIDELEEALIKPDATEINNLKDKVAMLKVELLNNIKSSNNEKWTNNQIVNEMEEKMKLMNDQLEEERKLHLMAVEKLNSSEMKIERLIEEKKASVKEAGDKVSTTEKEFDTIESNQVDEQPIPEVDSKIEDGLRSPVDLSPVEICVISPDKSNLSVNSPDKLVLSDPSRTRHCLANSSQFQVISPPSSDTQVVSSPSRTRKSSTGPPKLEVTSLDTPVLFSPSRTRKSPTGSPQLEVNSPCTPVLSNPRKTKKSVTGSPQLEDPFHQEGGTTELDFSSPCGANINDDISPRRSMRKK